MKIKKLAALSMAAVMAVGLAGCGAVSVDGEKTETKTSAAEATSTASGTTQLAGNGGIGFSVSTLNNPFFVTMSDAAKEQAKKDGLDIDVVDAGDDAAKQTSDIEDLVSKNISVLLVNPVDSDAVAPAVQDAIAAGVKVISLDRVVNGVDVDCQIASDNVAGAKMATEYLEKQVGQGAKVAEIQGTTGASATIDRGEGFHQIADKDFDVVSSQTANFNRSDAMTVMENMLQANGDIKGVFAHNDEMALGAIEAIGEKDIKVVGFDATDDGLAAVKDGKMAATIAQQPDQMGMTAVDTAQDLINGKSVEKSIPVEVKLITADNLDEA